jgi:hypothetical protein
MIRLLLNKFEIFIVPFANKNKSAVVEEFTKYSQYQIHYRGQWSNKMEHFHIQAACILESLNISNITFSMVIPAAEEKKTLNHYSTHLISTRIGHSFVVIDLFCGWISPPVRSRRSHQYIDSLRPFM